MKINVVFKKVDAEYLEKNFDWVINMLYPARREAVLKFKNKKAAYVSMTAGLLLQEVVKDVLGLLAEEIVIGKNEHGKPFIQGHEEFKYNISHSGNMVMLAYSKQEVGADIEELRNKDIKVAKRCFNKSEYDYVLGKGQDDNDAVTERFFRVWTMKEAYLKYSGKGISVPLDSFLLDMENLCVEGEPYKFYTKRLDNYTMAICAMDISDISVRFS